MRHPQYTELNGVDQFMPLLIPLALLMLAVLIIRAIGVAVVV
jgi:hypothetical protein